MLNVENRKDILGDLSKIISKEFLATFQLQYTKSTYRNHLCFCTLAINYLKRKLEKKNPQFSWENKQ